MENKKQLKTKNSMDISTESLFTHSYLKLRLADLAFRYWSSGTNFFACPITALTKK
jgi:hypothetical protein